MFNDFTDAELEYFLLVNAKLVEFGDPELTQDEKENYIWRSVMKVYSPEGFAGRLLADRRGL